MTRVDQRQVLGAFSREYTRELHNLLATDLGRFPAFVFQQLYNRLQWHVTEGEAAERITNGAARRCAPVRPLWLHLRTRMKESEALIRTLAGHPDTIFACAFSPDGRRIVSASGDNTLLSASGKQTLKLWDAETGRCVATLEGHGGWVLACAFSPDGRRIVSASRDDTLRLWDAETGACLATLEGHEDSVFACAFSPDGRRLVSGSGDATLKLWDAATGACRATLEGHGGWVNACAFSPDGRRLVSGSTDHSLKLWDAETGACEATLEGHGGPVLACAFSPDGRRLVSAGDVTLKLWDAETGACEATLEGHGGPVLACAFSPDGRRLVSGSNDCTLKLWDAETGACEATLVGHDLWVRACAFSPDGRRLVSGSDDCTLKLWDAETGVSEATFEGHYAEVRACAFSPDGRRLVSGSDDGILKFWDAETGACETTLRGHDGWVRACAFSPDRGRLVSAGDVTLKLWDVETGVCEATLEGHDETVLACAFSPDGRRLASGSADHTLKLWDAETGACEVTLEGHDNMVSACAFSPDGRRLVSGSADETLKLWDVETGACEATLEVDDLVLACAFSPDGQRLVSGGMCEETLKLWDVETGACEVTLEGHRNWVNACAFFPDGRRLVSASGDKTLKLWDAETGREIADIRTPFALLCVAAHPARPRLAFGDDTGIVSLVDLHGMGWGGAEDVAPFRPVRDIAARKQAAVGGDRSRGPQAEGEPSGETLAEESTRAGAHPSSALQRVTPPTLADLLTAAGFSVEEGEVWNNLSFRGEHVETVVVSTRELGAVESLAGMYAQLPQEGASGERAYRVLLRATFDAPCVKAFLQQPRNVVGAEAPLAALTPERLVGICAGVAAMADVTADQLESDDGLEPQIAVCEAAQASRFSLDRELEARRLVTLLDEAGLPFERRSETAYLTDLRLDDAEVTCTVYLLSTCISFIVFLNDIKPRGEAAYARLLSANGSADVAKCGINSRGELALLYEVPALHDDLLEHLVSQFTTLWRIGMQVGRE